MYLKLFLLSTLLAFVRSDDVHELGDNDFSNKLANMETALVMFYAPWCGHCKRLKPEFKEAASILKENDPPVDLVQVDCTEAGKSTCSKFGVSGYPTVKIFKSGELSTDYNGPREKDGIVKYMRAQVGPASKELKSVVDTEAFLSKKEVSVVYFGGESALKKTFLQVADMLRESVRFGHAADADTLAKFSYKDQIVLIRPAHLDSKFEESKLVYEGAQDKNAIKKFIKDNFHGLVGHRTVDSAGDFENPLVVAYYAVDYVKNAKGTNYWRNRILKVAKNFAGDFTFAISNKHDFQAEMEDYSIDWVSGKKPVILAKDAKGRKFKMEKEFTMEDFESFLTKLKAGELTPHLKSEEVPETQGNVIVAVGKNFDEVVTNSGKDCLIEFYAPWCGHCKKLAPVYDELGEKMKDEDVNIVKIDANSNDFPSDFQVRGFPTIYWLPKGGKPVQYQGGREVHNFVEYIAEHATTPLKGFDKEGNEMKTEL